ncbi:aldehyde dehydrogenase family protein [Streptomyces sp. NPDC050636]|uniref:aldehyde dehydrogenase family protein n=1 Tax=Streptomyces sp. NPDC050636 TaxID=3154510 RepID=UPI0034494F28
MVTETVRAAVRRARVAQEEFATWSQQQVDDVVAAVGWQFYQEDTARELALLSERETGLGDREHLCALQRRRVLGILRDLHGMPTVGVVEDLPELGLVKLAKPLGVIAAASPATAPAPGLICNALPILKTRNAAVFTPNPRAHRTAQRTVELMRDALDSVGAPRDLVQCLEVTGRQAAVELMRAADHIVAVGGTGTVRRAYESGTPAIGAGEGNPTVIVDETADLADAAEKVAFGAGYNNGTSCSSESNVLVHSSVADRFRSELVRHGVHLCSEEETRRIRGVLWSEDGKLDRDMVGRPATSIAERAGVALADPDKATVLALTGTDPERDDPILREKIAPLVTLLTYDSFDHAVHLVQTLSDRCGRGHSCAIHSTRADRVMQLAETITTCRVVVNQSTMTNTGSFASGVPFTTTLSSGSWGGTSVSGNITWRHFLNYTLISRPIPESLPDERLIFGKFWGTAQQQPAAGTHEEGAPFLV